MKTFQRASFVFLVTLAALLAAPIIGGLAVAAASLLGIGLIASAAVMAVAAPFAISAGIRQRQARRQFVIGARS